MGTIAPAEEACEQTQACRFASFSTRRWTCTTAAHPAKGSRRGARLSLGRAELVPRRGTCSGAAGGGEHEGSGMDFSQNVDDGGMGGGGGGGLASSHVRHTASSGSAACAFYRSDGVACAMGCEGGVAVQTPTAANIVNIPAPLLGDDALASVIPVFDGEVTLQPLQRDLTRDRSISTIGAEPLSTWCGRASRRRATSPALHAHRARSSSRRIAGGALAESSASARDSAVPP